MKENCAERIKKSRDIKSWVNIVDEFAESEGKSRIYNLLVNDQVKILVVIKTSAKTKTSSKQDRQKQAVHIL